MLHNLSNRITSKYSLIQFNLTTKKALETK